MTRQPFKSSNIKTAGFDSDADEIEVEFHGGGVYRYENCNQGMWDAMCKFPSAGKYHNRFLRPRKSRKIDSE